MNRFLRLVTCLVLLPVSSFAKVQDPAQPEIERTKYLLGRSIGQQKSAQHHATAFLNYSQCLESKQAPVYLQEYARYQYTLQSRRNEIQDQLVPCLKEKLLALQTGNPAPDCSTLEQTLSSKTGTYAGAVTNPRFLNEVQRYQCN